MFEPLGSFFAYYAYMVLQATWIPTIFMEEISFTISQVEIALRGIASDYPTEYSNATAQGSNSK